MHSTSSTIRSNSSTINQVGVFLYVLSYTLAGRNLVKMMLIQVKLACKYDALQCYSDYVCCIKNL